MKSLKTSSESEKARKEHITRIKTTSWNQGDGSIGVGHGLLRTGLADVTRRRNHLQYPNFSILASLLLSPIFSNHIIQT
jgi:hypothetical protein